MLRRRNWFALFLFLALPLFASGATDPSSNAEAAAPAEPGAAITRQPATVPPMRPLSRVAFGGGIGVMGINLQAATMVNRYTNIRATGNVFNYDVTGISSNGFTANGTLSLASMGASLDYFPFPRHGFRLSPGMLFVNRNSVSMTAQVKAGESFTLNNVDYYSAAADPIRADASVRLNATNPAFTATTGWGNMISRKGGHLAFPFEIGAAFVGTPVLKMTLAGTVCDASGVNCVNAATDPEVQSNLNAQITKYRKDLDVLKVFPILSFGVSYNFASRSAR